MTHTVPHYTKQFYAGDKPYRDSLIAAHKHFGMAHFAAGEEFWTLGGMEWCELLYLQEEGMVFEPGTYHNVDRGELALPPNESGVPHPHTDFFDIPAIWSCPRAICYDSTVGLVNKNYPEWKRFYGMCVGAARLSGKVVASWNYMTAYGNLRFDRRTKHDALTVVCSRLRHWIDEFRDYAECAGLSWTMFNSCVLAPKEKSLTPMLCGHCLLEQ